MCAQHALQCKMDPMFDRCDDVINTSGNSTVHGKNDVEHEKVYASSHTLPMTTVWFSTWQKCGNGYFCDILFMCIWCTMCSSWSWEDQWHPCHAPTRVCHTVQVVLLDGHVFGTHHHINFNIHHQKAFDHIKSLVCNNTTLHYYYIHKSVIIQVGSSKYGLGAAMFQMANPRHLHQKFILQFSNAMPTFSENC